MDITSKVTVSDIANFLQIPFKGDGNQFVTGLNEIHKVRSGDVTFVDIAKYYQKALQSAASIIIINQEVDVPTNKSILISENPFTDYNRLVNHYKIAEDVTDYASINNHYEGKNVIIGEGTQIHPGVVIGSYVTIGKNCKIYPNVVIYNHSIIGDNVIIHANTVIGADAFYYKNRGTHWEQLVSCGKVIIEDFVEIGASCTIDKGVSGDTIIKAHAKLDNHIHVGHGVEIGERTLIAAQVGIGGKTIIEEDVMIWGQVGITKDVTIGKKSILLAQSGVGKSLEGNQIYFGSPVGENRKMLRDMVHLRQIDELVKRIEKLEKQNK